MEEKTETKVSKTTSTAKAATKTKSAAPENPAYALPAKPEERNVYQRVLAVMADLDFVAKDRRTEAQGKYKYVSHDQVAGAVHPLLVRHGLVAVPFFEDGESGFVIEETEYEDRDGRKKTSSTTTLRGGVTFVNVDDPKDRYSVPAVGLGVDPSDKGPGKAYSYLTKMAYLKAFVLESGEKDIEEDDLPRGRKTGKRGGGPPEPGSIEDKIYGPKEAPFPTKCAICGEKIEKGELRYYRPSTKASAHVACYERTVELRKKAKGKDAGDSLGGDGRPNVADYPDADLPDWKDDENGAPPVSDD